MDAASPTHCLPPHLPEPPQGCTVVAGAGKAAASPAQLATLLISDVPGDDSFVIASGSTVADPTSFADALAILEKYGIEEPKAVLAHLRAGIDETPKPGDPRLDSAKTVMLFGGETTVTVRGTGRGGRDAEFLLALAVALDGHAKIHAIACDTDGIDGTEDNAGAILTPDTLERARSLSENRLIYCGQAWPAGFSARFR